MMAGTSLSEHPNVTELKYEGLVASPHDVLGKLMHRLGLELEDRQLSHSDIGNDLRSSRPEFARLSAGINSVSVARWKTELSESDVEQFLRVAGPTLSRLGYDQCQSDR